MEPMLSSDDSCDSEMKLMKNQLTEFGLEEENLSKEEMCNLLKALNNSKSTAMEDDLLRQKVEDTNSESPTRKSMKRKFLNVHDRRMPWSLFPDPLSQAEKARTLAVYIKMMSINSYKQARLSSSFVTWPPPIQIVEESTRVHPIRSTRSGRSVPVYVGFDDDSSDLDFIVTKPKKRKTSGSDTNISEGIYTNKVMSLKRKSSKEDNLKTSKEIKSNENNKLDTPGKGKKEFLAVIED